VSPGTRPSASVIVPFLGSEAELGAVVARLTGLVRAEGDEVLIADNEPTRLDRRLGVARVLPAPGPRAPGHARNTAARAARGEWLVFLDADTTPEPGLLGAYLDPAPASDVGVLVGGVEDRAERDTTVARYVSARARMDQRHALEHPYRPYGQTANCAVRAEAFRAVGGFDDRTRAGEDADLCWRILAAGWRLEERPAAVVAHRNRERVRDLLAQVARHGEGLAWLERRHPGSAPAPGLRDVVGRLPHYLAAARRAPDRERARYALLDLATLCARDAGRLRARRADEG
jgi:GT2 family glycosyltransferase